ncbi:hypothetical protein LJ707_09945 [Mucilaginibacter sp. UR6-1]|uniref:hypothetical protein n=1 Tax=Mucilaginibacter sp. UR6-1 TaxID=1435643 RepID=UPI001E4EC8DE|nr:hypothetical protein [Mucilaginibacter sp. UR6-1]MCC8409255.1 hypothetical protein [Mucilaginibacter sp. UR6-1]
MEIRLTETELFKSLTEIEDGTTYIDLHNEFDCKEVNISPNEVQLVFTNNLDVPKVKRVGLIFKDAKITKVSTSLQNGDFTSLTIDNIYRGRFENSDGLFERSDNGLYYYYVDFFKDYNIELFASEFIVLYN